MALAEIIGGATHNSTEITVSCLEADETEILLHKGSALIGSGELDGGEAVITVPALTVGDIIQASVTEKGNQCGNPVLVSPVSGKVTGWKSPKEVQVLDGGVLVTMPVETFYDNYGYYPASIYDPDGTGAKIPVEYEVPQAESIGFDILVNQRYNETQVFVQNIRGIIGGSMIRFNNGEWANTTSITLTDSGNLTIDVKGEDDSTHERRTISVTVAGGSSVTTLDFFYRIDYETNGITLFRHHNSTIQFKIEGVDSNWQDGTLGNLNEWYKVYAPMPAGAYIAWCRLKNDATSSNWSKIEFQKLK